jgi:tRNA G18 (ribose-2'-O)-methylase SpoU
MITSVIVVDNLRSNHNVGSLFRTADALGISKIYLCGTTPTPLDKYKRPVGEIAKTALGAEKTIPWEYSKTTSGAIKRLKKNGFEIIAIEQSKDSIDYKKVKPKKNVAFVLGNEVDGVSKNILKLCDIVAEIPMKGEKESLNVAVAGGVAIFRILDL